MAFFRQHVVGKMRFQVSVFRFQDFATRLPDTRNLKPFTTPGYDYPHDARAATR